MGDLRADLTSHIIDLGRYLMGEISDVCGLMETFTAKQPVLEAFSWSHPRLKSRARMRILPFPGAKHRYSSLSEEKLPFSPEEA
jgi:hypothetical protein